MEWLLGAAGVWVLGIWSSIRSVCGYLASAVIVTHTVDYDQGQMIAEYANRRWRRSWLGSKDYGAALYQIRKTRRMERRPFERLQLGSVFWCGWRPLWLGARPSFFSGLGAGPSRSELKVTYLRGMFDVEKLICDAMAYCADLRHGQGNQTRFRVIVKSGTWSQYMGGGQNGGNATVTSRDVFSRGVEVAAPAETTHGLRPIGWTWDEVGIEGKDTARLEDLALSPEAERIVKIVDNWVSGGAWYHERRIPWKLGLRLVGEPGCGKTALTRALAFKYDMPVFLLDLAGMDNNELREAWRQAMSETPCVVLLEDIDTVFDGRKPMSEHSKLTFDTLLQCLDGVEQHDGVLTIVTTNKPEKLDEALTREGRTDLELELRPPSLEGRRKIARRICGDWPELAEELAQEHVDKTGAAFQQICSQLARARFIEQNEKDTWPTSNGASPASKPDTRSATTAAA